MKLSNMKITLLVGGALLMSGGVAMGHDQQARPGLHVPEQIG